MQLSTKPNKNNCDTDKCTKKPYGIIVKPKQCQHTFCYFCFEKWFDKSDLCPFDKTKTDIFQICDTNRLPILEIESFDIYYDMIHCDFHTYWVKIHKMILDKFHVSLDTKMNGLKDVMKNLHSRLDEYKLNKDLWLQCVHVSPAIANNNLFFNLKNSIRIDNEKVLRYDKDLDVMLESLKSYLSVTKSYDEIEDESFGKKVHHYDSCWKLVRRTIEKTKGIIVEVVKEHQKILEKYYSMARTSKKADIDRKSSCLKDKKINRILNNLKKIEKKFNKL